MKNSSFIIIALLFLITVYTSNKVIIMTLEARTNTNRVNILQGQLDSLKRINADLYNYSIKLTDICDNFKSSREAKNEYVKTAKIMEL